MDNRERILAAAGRVYALHGFRGATTRLIAQEAGVNEVTLFRHFGSKAELFNELRHAAFSTHDLPLLPAAPADPEAELTAWCRETLDGLTQRRSVLRKMMSEAEENPEAFVPACEEGNCVDEALGEYIDRLRGQGVIAADADVATSRSMLMSALFGDAMTRELMPETKPQPYEDAPRRYVRAFLRSLGATVSSAMMLLLLLATPLYAQRTLSLEDAVRLAEDRSELVRVARAGAMRAEGQYLQARSQRLPQLNAVGQYQRTLKSQFSALASGGDGDDGEPGDTTGGGFGGIDFSRVGFGAENQWVVGLQFSQNLFAGGRIAAASDAARAGQRAADIELTAQRAQVVLDVAQAYYDAALADRLVAIADSTLVQTDAVLAQTRLARQVGNAAEFDLLRAQVAHENARPVSIQARGARDVAMLRLKQLLDIPFDEPLSLTTSIDSVPPPVTLPAGLGASAAGASAADTSAATRSIVRQAEENLRAQEALLRSARGERLPALALTSNYQRLYFPRSTFPSWSDFAENWTIGLSAQVNLFSGGRIRGQALVSRANVDEARARLDQVRELAALDARVAANQLAQAVAAWDASQGTVEQAMRAYGIDEVRYREGIATQTDLTQTRILVQQAVANRATAARDLAVARVRLALLRDLPLQLGGAAGGAANGAGSGGEAGGGSRQQQQQQQQQQQGTRSQGGGIAAASSLGGNP